MRRLTTVLLAAVCVLGSAGSALAVGVGPALVAGGQTIAGPGATTILGGATATVASNIPSVDACATVFNQGLIPIDFTMIGNGTGTVQVGPRGSASQCRGGLQTVNLTCLGNGTLGCAAHWRVDQLH